VVVLVALLLGVSRPPAAYLDTGSVRVPLAISSWCWGSRCGAPISAATRVAVVARGATLHAELRIRADAGATGGRGHAGRGRGARK